jgi:hypothetical protein
MYSNGKKKEQSRPKIDHDVGNVHTLLDKSKRTVERIAEQSKVNPSTVQRAEKFANAVDKVAENVGINPQKILSGEINASRRDIQEVSKYEPAFQKRVFEKVENKELKNINDAVKEVKKERM